jgi:hypothetical protein
LIAAATYVILCGNPSLYIASAIVAALALFWMRRRHLFYYGVIEVVVGLGTLVQQQAVGFVRGDFKFGLQR